ncbi:putative T7SS-secreted protein [Pseudonocardia endophytica]|uniref:putative T7SS-secreted protein n=1 Tax=Pseudonocardia endophytica TaxID=401976 RepID=UPI001043FDC9|nr:hypothetical protein [Pseudonocardia endophytica]
MSTELGSTEDPRALVPGDPASVAADARALADRATAVTRTGEALRRIGTGAWTGPASDAWREHHDEDAVRWFRGADSLDSASRALAGHADALQRAQSEAARALAAWRAGEAATADVRRQVEAGATAPPVDPGDAARQDAVRILAAARADVQRSGDRVASVLRGEAALAPRDSQKQTDADFYRGIRDSISGAAEGAWTLVSDPALAAAGVVQAAAHPADTAKNAIAYDDWTSGHEPRALGRNTGDLILGAATLGAGKITSILGRETRLAGEPDPVPSPKPETPAAPAAPVGAGPKTDAVRRVVLDQSGSPHGVEDSRGVYLVDSQRLKNLRQSLHAELGDPDTAVSNAKGDRETWTLSTKPQMTVTYRSFSSSGGPTIDINNVDGLTVTRFHIKKGPP